ncbi:MAG: hypothetical protein ACE5E5_00470 [Phycisphaerae bacterium]
MNAGISKAIGLSVAVAIGAAFVTPALGSNVDLDWAPQPRTVAAGVTFEIGLWATTADGGFQTISAMDVIVSWDAARVQLLGVINDGPYNWLQSGFPPDPALDGLNDSFLDGNAKYTALSSFGSSALATGAGLHVTTFQFVALTQTDLSHIVIEPALGNFSVTRVFGADAPNQNVTGLLFSAAVSVIPPADCDGDGDLDLTEFARLQACFTGAMSPSETPAYPTSPELCCAGFDYDDDGDIDLADAAFYGGVMTGPGS